jgi:cytochrome c peroxidase
MFLYRFIILIFSIACVFVTNASAQPDQQQISSLGKILFFDKNLSNPAGQSCSSCHAPGSGFSAPKNTGPISEGAIKGRFGNRNAPTLTYASHIPSLHYDKNEDVWIGGFFLDGRAKSLEDQAKGPFTNPLEMNNPNMAAVVEKVRKSNYAPLFRHIFGRNSLDNTEKAIGYITKAIATFERSKTFAPFSSKYDLYLQGKAKLSKQEMRGLKLFEDEKKGNCAACHPSTIGKKGELPLLTDFTYDNLGVPANLKSPFLKQAKKFNPAGKKYADMGLGAILKKKSEHGKFRVPTLRNVAITAPYMHNGVFKTLKEVVDFYNTRDVDKKWGKPEVTDNVNKDELGDLKLTKQEILDIVAFLKTLTDGYQPPELKQSRYY